jgi:hypothetical protein
MVLSETGQFMIALLGPLNTFINVKLLELNALF